MSFLLSLVLSFSILALARAAIRREKVPQAFLVLVVALPSTLFVCMILRVVLDVVFLQCLLSIILLFMAIGFSNTPRVLTGSLVVSMVLSYAVGGFFVAKKWRELEQLAAEFPAVSLEDRLAYETNRAAAEPADDEEDDSLQFSPGVASRLEMLDSNHDSHAGRERYLRQLHSSYRFDFAMASGFGVGRMPQLTRERMQAREREPIPLPAPPVPYASEGDRAAALGDVPAIAPGEESLQRMHEQGYDNFADREYMGFVDGLDYSIGFEPHGFQWEPSIGGDAWRITQLHLVSILKHDPPQAYVSENLPLMDELVDAPTRLLTPFEESSLEQLRTNEDLVIDDSDINTLRMVGSLRAAESCLRCHSVEHGELLGAFSYEISRMHPVPRPVVPTVLELDENRVEFVFHLP